MNLVIINFDDDSFGKSLSKTITSLKKYIPNSILFLGDKNNNLDGKVLNVKYIFQIDAGFWLTTSFDINDYLNDEIIITPHFSKSPSSKIDEYKLLLKEQKYKENFYSGVRSDTYKEFDWEVYLAKNEDLLQARLLFPNQLETHFSQCNHLEEDRITVSNKPRILFISHCYGAGTYYFYRFFQSLVSDKYVVLYYSTIEQLEICDLSKVKFLHINSTFGTNISGNYLLNFINKVKNLNIQINMTCHDIQWIASLHTGNFDLYQSEIFKLMLINLNKCIFPSQHVCQRYINYASNNSELLKLIKEKKIISYNPDYEIRYSALHITDTSKEINVAFIGHYYSGKGAGNFLKLTQIENYKGRKINYIIIGEMIESCLNPNVKILGRYNDKDLLNILYKNNINLVTFLVSGPETYGYTFSKGITSGIPVLYNNIGSFIERGDKNNERLFPIEEPFSDLMERYYSTLDYLILNSCKSNININEDLPLVLPKVYSDIYQIENEFKYEIYK